MFPSLSQTDWAMAAAMLAANTSEEAPISAFDPNFSTVRVLPMVLLTKVSLPPFLLGTLMVIGLSVLEFSKRAPIHLTAAPRRPAGVVGDVAAPSTAPIDFT